jgi:TolA-binding protein
MVVVLAWQLAGSQKLAAQNASPSSDAGAQNASIESQLQSVMSELQQLRQENRQLQSRISQLETSNSEHVVQDSQAASSTQQAEAASPSKRAGVLGSETPVYPTIKPFGQFGMQYMGLFNSDTPKGYTNYYNQPQVLGRFGVLGQLSDRVTYLIRMSTGISTTGANPWISFADPGDRRYLGFDEYNVAFTAVKGKKYTQTIIAGKVADVPAALGTTQLLVGQDFGLPLIADLSNYKINDKAQVSFLASVGFVTNQGANVVDQFDRQLHPVVAGVGGLIDDINQNGPPRANAYLAQLRGDYTWSSSLKFHGSFGFLNISHVNDVPLFEGATSLNQINGLRLAGMPDGTSTNLPAQLPRDPNGFVSIIGPSLPTALVTYRDASAYHILDTFGSVTMRADQRYPVRLFVDWSHNLGAGDSVPGPATPGSLKRLAQKRADGLVLGLDYGTQDKPKQLFFNYQFVLIQSDATLDYVNNYMWHTNIRGHDFLFKYALSKYITPFAALQISQNYDPRLVGFSTLATYPARNLQPGENPWMWWPQAGVMFNF